MNSLFNALSAGFALVAAVMWLLSATLQSKAQEKIGPHGWTEASLVSDGFDVIESGKVQQKWSRKGAYAAAIAAVFQALAALA